MFQKIGIIFILIISLMFLGCTESNSDIDNTNETLTNVNITPITEPELKIMSVTIVSGVANIKVKNIGNATAKDVYVGIVGISDTSYLSWSKPDYSPYIQDLAYEAMLHGSYIIESDTYLNPTLKDSDLVLINSELIHKEYIGNLKPGEMVTSEFGIFSGYSYDKYIKMAWTSNYSDYTTY